MKIKSLVIENFKSIERIELVEPNPLTVFVGPNGSGKSNIFEALEFVNIVASTTSEVSERLFGGKRKFLNRKRNVDDSVYIQAVLDSFPITCSKRNSSVSYSVYAPLGEGVDQENVESRRDSTNQFLVDFSHLFIGSKKPDKLNFTDSSRLSFSGSNLESVLGRIIQNSVLHNEIFEWLELFVPGFKAVEVDDRDELHWFEQSSSEYFTKDLISDGTYNILALLTAVYQSDDKPQFLCIEEPENGLHPQVAAELVDFFRIMCEERGHYIWLNTHSQSMASRVRPSEFVVVEKKQGATSVRQFHNEDFNGMSVDEAWLTNALNGGLAW